MDVRDDPMVSVIMPAYNAERYISKAIESILNQTYSNLELIIIEDFSSDHTADVIRKYDDKRIRCIQHNNNNGISHSTNEAIEISTGKYIALMDDDDIASFDRIELEVDYLEQHEEIDIVGGVSKLIDSNDNEIGTAPLPLVNPLFIRAVLLLYHWPKIVNGTIMIRKDFIVNNNLRYRENCYGFQDLQFDAESSRIGKITSIGKTLLYYRLHEDNASKRYQSDEKRMESYAYFQRKSLIDSGYVLNEDDFSVIKNNLSEVPRRHSSYDDSVMLYNVLKKILKQAKDMNVDYYQELVYECKKRYTSLLYYSDIFDDDWIYEIHQ